MVKARAKRNLNHRFDPLSKPEVDQSPQDIAAKVFLTQLRSPDESQREIGCIAVANLSSKQGANELISLLLERFTDASAHVVLAALHATQTLIPMFTSELVSAGAFTLIEHLLDMHFARDSMIPDASNEAQTSKSIGTEAVNLLICLAEDSEDVFNKVSSSKHLQTAAQFILHQDRDFSEASLDLFYLCTEDNPSIVTLFPEEMFGNFYNMISEEPNFTNVLLSGILINICLSTRASSYIDAKLLKPVLVCLSIDTASDFQNNLLPPQSEDAKPPKAPYILFMNHAKTQQIALQIVGNMFTTDSEGDVPIGFSYLSLDMLKNICRCAAGLSSSIVSTKSEYSDCISECLNIQELSCSCLQNIFLHTDSNYYTVQQLISAHIVWEGLIASLQKLFGLKENLLESDESFLEALEAITGCIRVFLQRYSTGLVGRIALIPLFISLSEISSSKLHENIYGIIAKLGIEAHSLDESRLILQFLIKGCMSQDLEVVVEALNCFFDIYGEEQYDSLFKEMNIVASMEAGVAVLLQKIRKELDADVRENAELAYANLIEYIKYKKEHIIQESN